MCSISVLLYVVLSLHAFQRFVCLIGILLEFEQLDAIREHLCRKTEREGCESQSSLALKSHGPRKALGGVWINRWRSAGLPLVGHDCALPLLVFSAQRGNPGYLLMSAMQLTAEKK